MAEVDLRSDHLAVVKAILKAEVPNRDVWAFGSRAKWTAQDTSDLDLAIVGDRPLPLGKLARLRQAFEESYLPFEVDVVDWQALDKDFRFVILAQKVVLQHGRDARGRLRADDSWRSVPLGECAEFLSGGTPSRANPEYWHGEIPWVTAKDMKQLRLYDTEDHVTPKAVVQGTRVVPPGTVLVLVRGMTLHSDLPICITRREMAFNQDVRALRPQPGVDADFLAYTLLANKAALLSLVDAASHGTGRIHSGALAGFPIALPPLAEQLAIASILKALDDKIELNHRMNQTYEAMARAVFKSWFVDFDPVRERHPLFPKHLKNSKLGPIPAGWIVGKLSDLCKTQYGFTASAKVENVGPKFLRVMDINKNDWIDWERVPRCIISEQDQRVYQLAPGDIVIARMADPGKAALIDEPIDGVFASYLVRLKAVSPAYIQFIYGFVKSYAYVLYADAVRSGSVQSSMNARIIVGADLVIPPEEVAATYSKIVKPLRSRIATNVRQSGTLAVIRDILLPKLLFGEIRVTQADRMIGQVA